MARGLFVSAILAIAGLPGCTLAPALNVTGTWVGHYLKSGAIIIELRQDGDTITGTGCEFESGVRIFSGAPVHGEFPRMRMTVGPEHAAPCCPHRAGTWMEFGVFDKREIAGSWHFANGRVSEHVYDFRREDTHACPR